jgi:hypothetical protein
MESNFVSDISGVLFNHYINEEYQEIYNAIDASISDLQSSMNYDSAYRLQQDIAFLNTSMLLSISKYINTNISETKLSEEDKTKQDTMKEQSESSKVDLSYKYVYLIIKLIIVFSLLGLFYFKLIATSNVNSKPTLFDKIPTMTS